MKLLLKTYKILLVVRGVQGFLNNPQNITAIKVLIKGKLIAVAYTLRTY